MESDFIRHCQDIVDKMNLRLYRVLGVTACASNTLGFAANIISHGFSMAAIFFGVGMLIVYLAFYLGEKRGMREGSTLVMIIVTTLIEFPVMCYLFGNNRTVFCIFSVAIYVFFLKKKTGILFLILSIVLNSGALALRELWPEHIAVETRLGGFMTMLTSFILVMVVAFMLLDTIRNMLDAQQESIMNIGRKMEEDSVHDALTGLYNRQFMNQIFGIDREEGESIRKNRDRSVRTDKRTG